MIRKVQLKATRRWYLTPVRMEITKINAEGVGENVDK
jgi:hypothetical protein